CARGLTGERRRRGHLARPTSVSRKALAAPYQPKRTNSCPSEKAKTNRCPQTMRNTRIATTPRRRRPRRRADLLNTPNVRYPDPCPFTVLQKYGRLPPSGARP